MPDASQAPAGSWSRVGMLMRGVRTHETHRTQRLGPRASVRHRVRRASAGCVAYFARTHRPRPRPSAPARARAAGAGRWPRQPVGASEDQPCAGPASRTGLALSQQLTIGLLAGTAIRFGGPRLAFVASATARLLTSLQQPNLPQIAP